jgi:hypothetical protein
MHSQGPRQLESPTAQNCPTDEQGQGWRRRRTAKSRSLQMLRIVEKISSWSKLRLPRCAQDYYQSRIFVLFLLGFFCSLIGVSCSGSGSVNSRIQ